MNVRRRWRLLLRLNAIRRVFMRHGLDELVWRLHLLRPIAWLRALLPRRRPRLPLGARLRLALEELGPIYVKFGQALSVRPDLLAPEVAFELAKLQDQVPPFAGEAAVAALERAYGRPVDDVFAFFDREPLAAASIAQVHAARLRDGTDVVVKVLRPNVRALIERDVEVLYAAAALAERYWPEARRLPRPARRGSAAAGAPRPRTGRFNKYSDSSSNSCNDKKWMRPPLASITTSSTRSIFSATVFCCSWVSRVNAARFQ
jgi:predicted unusual protein kinase regulating ubiquinone biosynthesis (AarF/ABC1/UbiB family)